MLTSAVQTLASVLLPSATVFLLLLGNDKAVLGPWVNGVRLNLFTGAVIAVLVMLSLILTASVLYPDIGERTIFGILGGGTATAALTAVAFFLRRGRTPVAAIDRTGRETWRMPPLAELAATPMTPLTQIWMFVLRGCLVVAGGLVLVQIIQLATGQG